MMNTQKEITEIKQKYNALYLTWVINNICPNKCSYCPPILHEGANHHYDWEAAKSFSQHLIDKYPKIHLAIAGGEPTMSPFFTNLVDMFYQAGHPVGVTTNGARTVRYYEEIASKLSYVVLSYHYAFKDPDFLEKALVCGEKTKSTVHVMMDSRYFDKCLEMFYKFAEYDTLMVEAVRINEWIKGDTSGRDYTDKQLDILTSLPSIPPKIDNSTRKVLTAASFHYNDNSFTDWGSAQLLMNEGKNRFLGWRCNIGIESLFVHFHGNIQRGNCSVGNPVFIGNVNDFNNINWPSAPVICTQVECQCSTDIYVSKKKID